MKRYWLAGCLLWVFGVTWAGPAHVVMVTPRGETQMERVFQDELRRRITAVRFTLIQPDVNETDWARQLVERIRQAKPTLIYTWGTPATLAVAGTHDRPVIGDIPIVFAVVAYPTEARLVKSLNSPGRNVTGTSHLLPMSVQLSAMRLYRAFDAVGVVYNPQEPNTLVMLEQLQLAAKREGFKLLTERVPSDSRGLPDPRSLPELIKRLKSRGANWLYLGPDTFVGFTHRQLSTQASLQAGLPAFSANESAVLDGHAVFGVFSPVDEMAKFVAFKASQILNGERNVETIPVDTLQRFSAVVNLCAAQKLGLPPPESMRNQLELLEPETQTDDPTPNPALRRGCKPVP